MDLDRPKDVAKAQGKIYDYLSQRDKDQLYVDTGVRFRKSGGINGKCKKVIDISATGKKKRLMKITAERREFLMRQIIGLLVVPNPPRIMAACKKIGISIHTFWKWQDDPMYLSIKSEYREYLKKKWAADIDAKLVERCLTGSKGHMQLYYQLQGELTEKVEISTDPRSIPDDPEKVQEEINKLIAETSDLE